MIDRQIDRSREAQGKHLLRGNVHGNEIVCLEVRRCVVGLHIGQELGDDLGVGKEIRVFAQAAQAGAEGSRAAHGIPVRVAVGHQKDSVLLLKKGSDFLRLHRSRPRHA